MPSIKFLLGVYYDDRTTCTQTSPRDDIARRARSVIIERTTIDNNWTDNDHIDHRAIRKRSTTCPGVTYLVSCPTTDNPKSRREHAEFCGGLYLDCISIKDCRWFDLFKHATHITRSYVIGNPDPVTAWNYFKKNSHMTPARHTLYTGSFEGKRFVCAFPWLIFKQVDCHPPVKSFYINHTACLNDTNARRLVNCRSRTAVL